MKQLLLLPILISIILSADNTYMEKIIFTPESKVEFGGLAELIAYFKDKPLTP